MTSSLKLQQIYHISEVCRAICVKFCRTQTSHFYFCHTDLSCMCASASLVLSSVLKHLDIPCQLIEDSYPCESHCYVLIPLTINDKIYKYKLDITASQYGGPPIHLSKKRFSIKGYVGFRPKTYHYNNSLEGTLKELKNSGWSDDFLLSKSQINKLASRTLTRILK